MSDATGSAFPTNQGTAWPSSGLTKRELFAAMALQGLLANDPDQDSVEGVAHDAVWFADALLAELAKEVQP